MTLACRFRAMQAVQSSTFGSRMRTSRVAAAVEAVPLFSSSRTFAAASATPHRNTAHTTTTTTNNNNNNNNNNTNTHKKRKLRRRPRPNFGLAKFEGTGPPKIMPEITGLQLPYDFGDQDGLTGEEYHKKASLSPWVPIPDPIARKLFDMSTPTPEDVRTYIYIYF